MAAPPTSASSSRVLSRAAPRTRRRSRTSSSARHQRRLAVECDVPVVRGFEYINPAIYVPMQGPSELGASVKLEHWDRTTDLQRIDVPTLVMGAEHDTMDPAHLRWMAEQLPHGRYHHSPDGSHLSLVDDADVYFAGLVEFLHSL